MKKTSMLILAVALMASIVQGQNLLLNGNFNSPNSSAVPDNWFLWSFGGGYSNHEVIAPAPSVLGNYDSSFQMTLGAANTSGGAGVYQTIAATEGLTYTLSVDAGAQNWWLPTGQIRLFFFDSGNNQLGVTQVNTTDGIHSPDQYDTGVAYQTWSLNALAPIGTTQAKVELAGYGGGSTWFDNAVLTVQAVPEPSSMAVAATGFGLLLVFHVRRRNSLLK